MVEVKIKGRHRGLIALAAGGTGGHLFPAQALAEELVRRGYLTVLMSDERAKEYGDRFPAIDTIVIPSSTITLREPWKLPFQAWKLWAGEKRARVWMEANQPRVVVGFGGYPSFPPLWAATRLGIPVIVHEQNAVMGRANRFLAKHARIIASSFPEIANIPPRLREKVAFTGNPVRDAVLEQAGAPYAPPEADEVFELLVFGGSQGAHYFAELLPALLAELPGAVRRGLHVTQQCREEDIETVKEAYAELGVKATLAEFFDDMPARMAAAHLVIARAGASSIAELAVIGRPALLVPLPHALDNDQLMNARAFAGVGAGWVFRQHDIEPGRLAAFITRLRYRPEELAAARDAALAFARPDAAKRLADVVEKLVRAAPERQEIEEAS